MKIETFTVCYNEAKMLPYFLRHYSRYGHVTVFDNHSTDGSAAIAKDFNATVIPFNSDDRYREDILTHLRNNCWKESQADWVIVADVDEIVYHRMLDLALSRSTGTIIMPHMFEMFSETFPKTKAQIYEEVNTGIEMRSKMFLFRPSDIKEINYDPGSHHASPEGKVVIDVQTGIIAMHFKYVSLAHAIDRYEMLSSRQSEENKANGWSWHMNKTPGEFYDLFQDATSRLMKIL
jgi:glycosyltransferase involved in cell wall biosynthesis